MNQIEVLKKLVDERKDEIFNLGKKVNYDNLVFNYKEQNKSGKSFSNFTEAIILFEKIKKGDMELKKCKRKSKRI